MCVSLDSRNMKLVNSSQSTVPSLLASILRNSDVTCSVESELPRMEENFSTNCCSVKPPFTRSNSTRRELEVTTHARTTHRSTRHRCC